MPAMNQITRPSEVQNWGNCSKPSELDRMDALMGEYANIVQRAADQVNKMFPPGARVTVVLHRSQKIPSAATVVKKSVYGQPGFVTVKLDNVTQFSQTPFRAVHYTNVFPQLSE